MFSGASTPPKTGPASGKKSAQCNALISTSKEI
jgi:hypothetical protein